MPVYNEEQGARRLDQASARVPRRELPVLVADRDRRQREHRRDARGRRAGSSTSSTTSRSCTCRRRAAVARCGRRGRPPTPRSRATWTSTCRPTCARCCRSWRRSCPATATLAIGTRLAPGLAGRARPEARVDLALLQPPPAHRRCAPVSPMPSAASRPRTDALRELLPDVRDEAWFFDTELLVLAQRRGLRVHEVPVDWVDDPDSRVAIVPTAIEDLRGVARLLAASQVARFVAVGIASTLAYALLYLLLRGPPRPAPRTRWRSRSRRSRTRPPTGAHLRRARARGPAAPARARGARLLHHARAHERGARGAARAGAQPAPLASPRGDRARGGQRLRHGHPLRRPALVGVRANRAASAGACSHDLSPTVAHVPVARRLDPLRPQQLHRGLGGSTARQRRDAPEAIEH